jgi:hypothetical protein
MRPTTAPSASTSKSSSFPHAGRPACRCAFQEQVVFVHYRPSLTWIAAERKWLHAIIHEGDDEAVVKEKQEKALAEHVTRHPEDVGLTVKDFKWIMHVIVKWPREAGEQPPVDHFVFIDEDRSRPFTQVDQMLHSSGPGATFYVTPPQGRRSKRLRSIRRAQAKSRHFTAGQPK